MSVAARVVKCKTKGCGKTIVVFSAIREDPAKEIYCSRCHQRHQYTVADLSDTGSKIELLPRAIGRFAPGVSDVSTNHDSYLAKAFRN